MFNHWDNMFGSFQDEVDEEPVRFGLANSLPPKNNALKLIFQEWTSIKNDISKKVPLSTKFKYVFMRQVGAAMVLH
jgi:hypothetical protein